MHPSGPGHPLKIVIAGGGFAAVESMLALRALLGSRAAITMVSPSTRLAYHPAATAEAFGNEPSRAYDLTAIAGDLGVELRHDRLQAVASEHHRVRLGSFATLSYDALILALGARGRVAIPGALTFRDQRDVPKMRGLIEQMRAGRLRRLLFAVPSGCAWPLPIYELALLSARDADARGLDVEIDLLSPAPEPLDIFGPESARAVRALLAERRVGFTGGVSPACVRHDGSLALHFGGAIAADRVVAAAQLRGPRLAGVPARWWGFVPVDAQGRVEGLSDVYAAGDMTDFPIKQAGLATQQADTIAHVIAARAGAGPSAAESAPGRGSTHVLEASLLGGEAPLALRTGLHPDAGGAAEVAAAGGRGGGRADPLEKVGGRYLRAYLAGRAPLTV